MSDGYVRVKIWDAPTRLFHWAIVILVGFSWFTGSRGWLELHFLSGYSILALLLFRLVWGLVGSDTARFSRFLRSPFAALHHLRHLPRREPDLEIGHNAAGGWMVLVMLLLLLVQVGSGLSSNDDVMTEGPLVQFMDKGTSDWLTHIHHLNFTLIEIAVALHILAIATYALLKRHDLVRPMITGTKRLPPALRPPRLASPLLAAAVFMIAAGAVVVFVTRL